MAKADDLYQLLVDLAEFDPELARPGDWLNYRVGLDTLARAGNERMTTHIFNVGNPQRIGTIEQIEAEVRPIHEDLRKVVRQFAGGTSKIQTVPITASVAAVGHKTPRLLATGSTRDAAILTAVMLLLRPDRSPIAICPEDDRLFVKVRRQQFCSRRCVNRANVRAYRQRMLEEKKDVTKKKGRKTR
jgi:hypothetical protein